MSAHARKTGARLYATLSAGKVYLSVPMANVKSDNGPSKFLSWRMTRDMRHQLTVLSAPFLRRSLNLCFGDVRMATFNAKLCKMTMNHVSAIT